MKRTDLLPRSRIYLFIAMLIGAFLAIYGFVNHNTDITIVGIIMAVGTGTTATVFNSVDEQNEKNILHKGLNNGTKRKKCHVNAGKNVTN